MGLKLSIRDDSHLYLHDTNTNKVGIIDCSRTKWTPLFLSLPQYMRVYRYNNLPPEVRQLVLDQHGERAFPQE